MAYIDGFNLNKEDTQKIVYGSKALHYWRKRLEAAKRGEEFLQEPPDRNTGQEP